jgi:hypothetical protein
MNTDSLRWEENFTSMGAKTLQVAVMTANKRGGKNIHPSTLHTVPK